MDYYIYGSAQYGRNCHFGHYSVISPNVKLGNSVRIGNNVTIHPGTVIGDNVVIGDNCTLGVRPQPAKTSTVKTDDNLPPLYVGPNTLIGTGVVLYAGTTIEENVYIGDLASVREKCSIGKFVLIGRGVAMENEVIVGKYTKIQTGSYITAYTEISENVFIAPMVTTTNDNFMGRTEERFKLVKGPYIGKGARIGGGVIILPGISIGEETFVAAGAVVTRDTKPRTVVKGIPARVMGEVPDRELLTNIMKEGKK